MAGGYASRRGIGIPIGERGGDGTTPASDGSPPVPGAAADDGAGLAVGARRLPFVYVEVDGSEVPGLVVEQRRGPQGWVVLVAMAHVDTQGRPGLRTEWFDPARLRPAIAPPTG